MAQFLSEAYLAEASQALADDAAFQSAITNVDLSIQFHVTDGPEGDVTYHLQVGDGAATFAAGAADPEDVKMEQDWATAVAVATGELNAQEAFITGRIRLSGDQQALMMAQPVFGALDGIFATVRDRTRYE